MFGRCYLLAVLALGMACSKTSVQEPTAQPPPPPILPDPRLDLSPATVTLTVGDTLMLCPPIRETLSRLDCAGAD
jgi:hypothetical protein